MKRFKAKNTRFGSLISLIALSAMAIVFSVNWPVFMESETGRIFAGFWGGFALVILTAHTVRLMADRQRQPAMPPLLAGRTRKKIQRVRMRG
ncbi:hypothetical protein [Sporomusa aerivorans]|uniref:hypothetical protein n=1 Tax=Sporomusa aerivorans TaxID=204936 RepID=UPI00352B6C5B